MDKDKLIGYLLLFTVFTIYLFHNGQRGLPNQGKETNSTNPVLDNTKQDMVASPNNIHTLPDNVKGSEKEFTIENDQIRVVLSNIGGRIKSVMLKKFNNHLGGQVVLCNDTSMYTNFTLARDDYNLGTYDKQFEVVNIGENKLEMLYADNNNTIKHIYELCDDDPFIVRDRCEFLCDDKCRVDMSLSNIMMRQEYDLNDCRLKTYVNYYDIDNRVKSQYEGGGKHCNMLKWIAMKQKFFTIGVSCDKSFCDADIKLSSFNNDSYVKKCDTTMCVKAQNDDTNTFNLKYYFGPNIYSHLRRFDINFEKNIYWGIILVSWFNKYVVNPIVTSLSNRNINAVMLIVLLVIFIKLMLLPLSWKSYTAMAQMKMLAPELNKIKAKYSNDLQQMQLEQIKLYQEKGINPLGGCLPLLVSMPFIVAMYDFIPLEMYFRHKGFLWVKDLSSYDSIYKLPFYVPFYGDHVSLLAILMTLSTIGYSMMNSKSENNSRQMMVFYIVLPLAFLGAMNNFCSALVLYYLVSNLVTIVIQFIMIKVATSRKIVPMIIKRTVT